MAPSASKRQRPTKSAGLPAKRRKFKKQTDYHSSDSEQDHAQIDEPTVDDEEEDEDEDNDEGEADTTGDEVEGDSQSEDEEEDSDSDADADASDKDDNPNNVKVRRKKRNDPAAFATSMSKILNAKLSVSKRADPVLSRSKEASAAVKESQEAKLEAKARQQIRDEKRAKMETGRVRDVKGLSDPNISTEDIIIREKKYKKLAQQGVILLFNAVLTAQMKGQEAARTSKQDGVVGIAKREEKVNEMSKQGFLDLITSGGKK